ncbi:TIGR03086 family metal-binding protein [Streptomyces sp. NPDC088196]|uniref:TIGR03086 family metal-binding protein n=1 Tax=Streptomyces sp. NPDC088196 TaxID=3154868 RepID=UPI00344FE056
MPRASAHHWLGADPKGAYAEAAEVDRAVWNRPGALDTTVHISLGALPGPTATLIHFTEVCVHGVDLAVATGQQAVLDEELCAELLSVMRGRGGFDAFRVPGVFGPEVQPAPGAARAGSCRPTRVARSPDPLGPVTTRTAWSS